MARQLCRTVVMMERVIRTAATPVCVELVAFALVVWLATEGEVSVWGVLGLRRSAARDLYCLYWGSISPLRYRGTRGRCVRSTLEAVPDSALVKDVEVLQTGVPDLADAR